MPNNQHWCLFSKKPNNRDLFFGVWQLPNKAIATFDLGDGSLPSEPEPETTVNAGDSIFVENRDGSNYQLIAYAYTEPSTDGYKARQYLRATDTNSWGERLDFENNLKYANGSTISYPV